MGGLLIPALALVIAAPASLGLFDLGDKLGAAQAQRARDERAAALRAAAERGERSWCELVNDDDRATSEDMRRCKESVESADDAAARRRELEYFFDRSELRSRYADQLGVTPAYYAERMPTIVPPLQPWLLEALFALALEDHALDTVEGRERLARLVGATWSLSWSAEALDAFERGPRKAIEHELETRTDWTGFGRDIRDSLVFELERVREQRIRRQ
jgi:hypothetical protein